MGFIKEVYENNRASLIVSFQKKENSDSYFEGDSVQEAMKYFNMYLKNNTLYIKTEQELLIENLNINLKNPHLFQESVSNLVDSLNENQYEKASFLVPQWKPNCKYKPKEKVSYCGKIYSVEEEHFSKEELDPTKAKDFLYSILGEAKKSLKWTDGKEYSLGEKVVLNNDLYESLTDANSLSPKDFPLVWKKIN